MDNSRLEILRLDRQTWVGEILEMHQENPHNDSTLPGSAVRKRSVQTEGRKKIVAAVGHRERAGDEREMLPDRKVYGVYSIGSLTKENKWVNENGLKNTPVLHHHNTEYRPKSYQSFYLIFQRYPYTVGIYLFFLIPLHYTLQLVLVRIRIQKTFNVFLINF